MYIVHVYGNNYSPTQPLEKTSRVFDSLQSLTEQAQAMEPKNIVYKYLWYLVKAKIPAKIKVEWFF